MSFRTFLMLLFIFQVIFQLNVVDGKKWCLEGKNCIVTGGSKGIGKSIVDELCELGATVITCARGPEELEICEKEWKIKGYKVFTCVADLSTTSGRDILKNFAAEKSNNKIHSLINNVGSNIRKKFMEYTSEDYNKIMETNLQSMFYLTQDIIPLIQNTGVGGSIVNIGSVAGGYGSSMKSGVIYAMTKAAMNQFAYNLACEHALDKIRVNVVSPWYTRTPLVKPIISNPVLLKEVIDRTPMNRIAEPEEVSGIVAFLCMDESSFITGQTIAVDGGYLRNGYYSLPNP